MLEKAATIKRFEYSLLGKELKAQIVIPKKQYQKLHNTYEYDRIKKEKPTIKKSNRSNLICSSEYGFYEYYNINFNNLFLTSKYQVLTSFYK